MMSKPGDEASEIVDDVIYMPSAVARVPERLRTVTKTRKSAATRARIMDAASSLMVERGTTDFQMSEVAQSCGVTKGALYYYFDDKESLTEAVFDDVLEDTVEAVERRATEAASAREALLGLSQEFSERMDSDRPFVLAVTYGLSAIHEEGCPTSVAEKFVRVAKVISAQFERAKGEGLVREDVNSDVSAVYMIGGFLMTSLSTSLFGIFEDQESVMAGLVDLTLRGVGYGDVSSLEIEN